MPRILQLVLFLLVIVSVTVGVHYYFWLRLVRDTAPPAPWRSVGTWTLVGLAISLPLSFPLGRFLPASWSQAVMAVPYVWMGMLLLLFFLLLLADVAHLGTWAASRFGHFADPFTNAERGLLVRRIVGWGGLGLVAILTGFAVPRALGTPAEHPVEVELPGLPRELDGFRIVQLTDLHVGSFLDGDWLAEVVERTNALEPDLVAITGDLVDGSVERLRDEVAPLGRLRARYGVFFVTGNHEYYSGVEVWLAELDRLGIRVLRNERVSIGPPGASFDLAGVDDSNAGGMADGHGPNPEQALGGRDRSRASVLLAHQPREVIGAAKLGVGLVLSGHTHGGQIWPWTYFVYLQQPYVRGLNRHDGSWVYVSDGTGFWGPPLRLGTRNEITVVTLRAPK